MAGLGLALGLFSWWGDRLPPEPGGAIAVIITFASLPGPWLAVAFAAGAIAGRPIGGLIAGPLTLGLAVGTYYVARGLSEGFLIAEVAITWLLVAALAGPVFGLAGGAWRAGLRRWSSIGIGLLGGSLLAEAALLVADASPYNPFFIGLPTYAVAAVEGAAGILLPTWLAGARERLLALAATGAAAVCVAVAALIAF
jgi:hypothetical protein